MKIVQRNGNYYLDFYFRGRRFREKVGPSKGAAFKARSVREGEILQGRFKFVPKRGAMTFKSLAAKYRELISPQKRSHHVEKYILNTLTAAFGHFRVLDLKAEDAERYKAERIKSVEPATVNRELTVAKHMLTMAVEWKDISESPFRGLRNLKVPDRDERILGRDEEVTLELFSALTQSRSHEETSQQEARLPRGSEIRIRPLDGIYIPPHAGNAGYG